MQDGEKNVLLDILRTSGLVNQMGFIGQGSIDLPQAVSWNAAANGKLTLATPITYNLTYTGPAYGLTVFSSSEAISVNKTFIALNFNTAIQFNDDDVYRVNNIDLTIND